MLADGRGGEHGQRLLTRNHYRLIYFTRDNPPDVQALFNDEEELQAVKKALGDLLVASKRYSNNWYKHDSGDIPVIGDHDAADVRPLSEYSSLLRKFTANDQELLYVKPEDVNEATPIVQEVLSTERVTQLRMEFPTARRKEVVSAS